MNKYEAAEMIVVGTASETILGEKVLPMLDNVSGGDPFFREEELAMFDE
jgi:predicted TIM-barrel enzyme